MSLIVEWALSGSTLVGGGVRYFLATNCSLFFSGSFEELLLDLSESLCLPMVDRLLEIGNVALKLDQEI